MKLQRFTLLIICMTFFLVAAQAQLTQTVRGKVVDSESQFPLEGVTVIVVNSDGIGVYSDEKGEYRLEKVPVGRQTIVFSYLGYQRAILNNIEVTSGKEVILNVQMEASSVQMDSVDIVARRDGEVSNELAFVSAREFSVVETNLYAGSRGEPARMASNYAGVQGADDSRNDIIIRGNSPQGVLWRLDGINIPNPNHFSIPGTGGGPVTILNNKFLTNSDFYTGAFPSEYGNGLAGVFDLKMRNGNNRRHEFSGQFGFLGTELMAEGPLTKNGGASYLATYRYSTLGIFGFLGINVGTDAIPNYQDGAFRINLPLKNGANISVWGIGGLSNIDIILSGQEAPDSSTLIYGDNDRDQYFGTNLGTVAASYTHPLNVNTFLKASVAVSRQIATTHHDQIF
ncbi:MAG: carboxypeptidase-like regulatory domain-containing protein, partial [Bacteroidetes bacterium]|nr:carboxypeptidase-like regulatory domain-containing protein [Bacteroidota bacterium]